MRMIFSVYENLDREIFAPCAGAGVRRAHGAPDTAWPMGYAFSGSRRLGASRTRNLIGRKDIFNDASCRGNYKYKRKLSLFAVGEDAGYCEVTPSGEARSRGRERGAERRRGCGLSEILLLLFPKVGPSGRRFESLERSSEKEWMLKQDGKLRI